MRRGIQSMYGNWRMGYQSPFPTTMTDLVGKENIARVTEAALSAKAVVNDVSDAATQLGIEKAFAALDEAMKRREKSNYCVDVTVSVSVGPVQITLASPDEPCQTEEHD